MVSVVQCFMSKLLSPLWRRALEDEEEQNLHSEGVAQIRQVQTGVVTHLCADYGLIDHAVYFTSEVVLGGVVLCVGDSVQALAVREGAHGQWRALRVELLKDMWESGGSEALAQDSAKPKPLIGTVTSCDRDGGLINQTTFFPRSALCEGFEPMKGDWVLAQYVVSPGESCSQAQAVSPLRYRRMDGVSVTRTQGNSGVVEDSVFFSLESLMVPPGFRPARGDVVNVVVLESSQSLYCWRALCMTPVQHSPNPSELTMPDAEIHSLLENKGGLQVSQETHFGPLLLGHRKELLIWIQNTGSENHRLKCCEFAGWDSGQQFCLSSVSLSNGKTQDTRASGSFRRRAGESRTDGEVEDGEGDDSVETRALRMLEIEPGEKVSVTISCQAKTLGRSAELLLLHFSSFTIARRLEVLVSCAEESLLKPRIPYTALTAVPAQQKPIQVLTVTAPPAPIRLTRRHLPNFLGQYAVPQALRDCVEAQKDVLVVQPALAECLSLSSMLRRFSALLWLEELEAERELREFSLIGAILRKGAVNLHLEVPGLTEGRPNLFIGDKVILKKPCSGGIVLEYMSYVTEISEDDVSLRVNADFQHSYLGEPLDVEFTFNRVTTRRCHCALEQVKHFGDNILFPSMLAQQPPLWSGEWGPQEEEEHLQEENDATQTINGSSSQTAEMVSVATQTKTDLTLSAKRIPNPGQFFNVQLNSAQKEAIKRILSGECRPTPYILFGPPGTGKTITLIEAILQVHHHIPCSRVLVCTPSNSAADLVCMRLHQSGHLNTASLARVNATCRPEESMPEELRQYARAGEDIRHASFHRIVVCTCSSAGMFYQIGLRVGHFTHVFVDEAGQATEPETLIPLGLLSETSGQIVLAGDPKQLGPVVKSRLAAVFGLGVSLLERLMGNPLYSCSERGYNPLLVTKLVYNYRSHEALLELPSRLFYAGELCVRSQRAVVDALCHWNRLPTKGFPFIFHGVRGTEMREGSNPSWFNPAEAVQVMMYCCQLAKRLYNPIPATDIGVIAPYKKQVRSNESLLNEELQNVLGFLSNPKRFNVAITRAKALLIVIGNPHILIKDPCFSALLQYSYDNRAFVGCDPPVSLRASSRILSEET
ncbi:RNA helicase Mov10l1 isoform X2 [Siphateles boraxobius]|uniref:RNA helicase Mov10l1 isoform X2 n=1 Tax=Siphateles boraxobius TaxID=180520 RepID=UPI004064B03C